MKVKHPALFIIIYFLLGGFAYSYGIQTVADWIIFIAACVVIYSAFYKMQR